jgi:hypothetical protein
MLSAEEEEEEGPELRPSPRPETVGERDRSEVDETSEERDSGYAGTQYSGQGQYIDSEWSKSRGPPSQHSG